MTEPTDHELLAEFARTGSETAFATLVTRYVNLVHSVARRFTGNLHHAEEITQAVFILLARKAGKISPRTVLSGWFYQTARLVAANFVKGEIRRQRRDHEAFMQSTLTGPETATWEQIMPLLDDAMGRLGQTDRNALLLRFFENKTAQEIAATLQMNKPAAQKRVHRALEKLRKTFAHHGVTSTEAGIARAISTHSVQAAPTGLAGSVTLLAVAKGAAASTTTVALVNGTWKWMAWTQAKTAVLLGTVLLFAAGTATVAVMKMKKPAEPPTRVLAGKPSGYPWQMQGFITNRDGSSSTSGEFLLSSKAPPLLEILPTVTPGNTCMSVTAGEGDEIMRLGFGATVQNMLRSTFGFDWTSQRTIVATLLPSLRYDYIDNLPQAATIAFKNAIGRKFGVAGRIATLETNVMLLQVETPGAPGLRPSQPGSAQSDSQGAGPGYREYHVTPTTLTNLAGFIENILQIPVVDQTGLAGNYAVDLKWESKSLRSEKTAFQKAILDQLGLKLVPSREKIDMLVIEKSSGPFPLATLPPALPGQLSFPKAAWAFAGYDSPSAALLTYFWALNQGNVTDFEASLTAGAREDFTRTLQAAGQTPEQYFQETAPLLKKISGYRILETNNFIRLPLLIALDGGMNRNDLMVLRANKAGWKVDEIPLHFLMPQPLPILPRQVDYPKAAWALAGYASPAAALQTYFWALNRRDLTNLETSITPEACEDFTNSLSAGGKTPAQFWQETGAAFEKMSGYRILDIQRTAADEVDMEVATKDGGTESELLTVKKIGTEWKVDESP